MAESGRWPGGSTAPLVPLLPRTRGHLTIRLKGQASQGAAEGLGPSHANRSDGEEATETLGRQAASEVGNGESVSGPGRRGQDLGQGSGVHPLLLSFHLY